MILYPKSQWNIITKCIFIVITTSFTTTITRISICTTVPITASIAIIACSFNIKSQVDAAVFRNNPILVLKLQDPNSSSSSLSSLFWQHHNASPLDVHLRVFIMIMEKHLSSGWIFVELLQWTSSLQTATAVDAAHSSCCHDNQPSDVRYITSI